MAFAGETEIIEFQVPWCLVIPVSQTKLYSPDGIHNGNCFAACIASMLDVPLWMVPPFEDMFGRGAEWRERAEEWLSRIWSVRLVRTEGHTLGSMPMFYIANGPSARGVHHSVIFSEGVLVHDPHPAKSGIESVDWCWHMESIQ